MNKFHVVKEVIDNWDPINLLRHAPDDEYDPEIKAIVNQFQDAESVESLALIIHQVFVRYFGDDSVDCKHYTFEKCLPVASEIWDKIYG